MRVARRHRGRRRARRHRPARRGRRRHRPGRGRGRDLGRAGRRGRTTWCSAPGSAAGSRRSASATSRWRARSCSPISARETAGRVRAARRRLRPRTTTSRPQLAVELADRTGGHLGTIAHRRDGDRHRRDAPTRCSPATRTPSPRRWRAPASPPRPRGTACAFAEIRAISNPVGPRDRDAWRIPDALAALGPAVARGRARMAAVKLAFSPCPNDTFVFHAWTHGLIAGRAAGRGHLRRHRRHQHRRRARRVRRGEGVLRRAAVAARPVRAAAQRRRARPRLRPARAAPAGDARLARRPHRRGAERALDGVPAVPAVGGRPAAGPHRRRAVRADHARRCATARYDAGLVIHEARFTYPAVRADGAGRPRRVVGARHRPADPARRDPGPRATSTPRALDRGGARVGRVRLGRTRPRRATTSPSTPPRCRRTCSSSTSSSTSTSSPATSATRATPRSTALLDPRARATGLTPAAPPPLRVDAR